MAETANIACMAELISEDIFLVFGWKKVGPMNENWICVSKEHNSKTHPSDVVFRYFDPYKNHNIYVNCDLKSYAKTSITKATAASAIKSLCRATECANISQNWANLYTTVGERRRTVGLLFVYNHDGDFDADFNGFVNQVDSSNFNIKDDNKVYLLGPRDVCFLNTIANDVCVLYGKNAIKEGDVNLSFHYPDLELEKLGSNITNCASIEMLMSNMIVFYMDMISVVYLKTDGSDVSEFEYIIDYLVHYQVLQRVDSIEIKIVYDCGSGVVNFDRAKRRYCEFQENEDLEKRLDMINCSSVQNVVRRFSSTEIGMDR